MVELIKGRYESVRDAIGDGPEVQTRERRRVSRGLIGEEGRSQKAVGTYDLG